MVNCADQTGCGAFKVLWPWISVKATRLVLWRVLLSPCVTAFFFYPSPFEPALNSNNNFFNTILSLSKLFFYPCMSPSPFEPALNNLEVLKKKNYPSPYNKFSILNSLFLCMPRLGHKSNWTCPKFRCMERKKREIRLFKSNKSLEQGLNLSGS